MDTKHARKRLLQDGHKCFEFIKPSDHYIRSYPSLLRAAKRLSTEMDDHSLITISHIAYGWMPTILKNVDTNPLLIDTLKRVLSAPDIKAGIDIMQELDASPVNNSWVGLSKVLHLLSPAKYPIWDSKVAKQFGKNSHHQMKRRENYTDYMKFIGDNSHHEIVDEVQNKFREKAGYDVSKVRACEFILFSTSDST